MTLDPRDDALLQRHLNGDLDGREQADFLERIARSPELRRALASRAIDETLLSEVVREGRVQVPARSRASWPAVAAAALMLVGLGMMLFPWNRRVPPPDQKGESPVATEEQKKIDEAVRKGADFLRSRRADFFQVLEDGKRHDGAPRRTYAELAALALVRAGAVESDLLVEELIGRGLARPLESTYAASLRSMLLAGIAPRRERLRECAQFLIDSQCPNGQWDYGRAVPLHEVPSEGILRRRRDGPASGDNSASAYAVQGLLACRQAGVEVEPEVLHRARRWWLSCQNPDGGWGYGEYGRIDQSGAEKRDQSSNSSYGSTTASGVASLAALRILLGPEPAAESALRKGVDWLAAHFGTEANPGKAAGFCHLHWLSASARAGSLLSVERFGARDWFAEGADFLLGRQMPDGRWSLEGDFMKAEKNEIVDTCLAILFLTRKG